MVEFFRHLANNSVLPDNFDIRQAREQHRSFLETVRARLAPALVNHSFPDTTAFAATIEEHPSPSSLGAAFLEWGTR